MASQTQKAFMSKLSNNIHHRATVIALPFNQAAHTARCAGWTRLTARLWRQR